MKNKESLKQLGKNSVFFAFFLVIVDLFLQNWTRKIGLGVQNTGISFGIGYLWGELFRYILPILVSVAGFLWMKYMKRISVYLFIMLVGGVGNMIARMFWGYVWDYLEIPYLGLWVNFSDLMISFGALSYILVGDDRDTNSI